MNGVHREAHNHLSLSTQTFLFLLQPLLPDHPPSLSPSSFFTSVFHPCFHNPSLSIRTCAPLSGLTLSQCFCFFLPIIHQCVFLYFIHHQLLPVSRLSPPPLQHHSFNSACDLMKSTRDESLLYSTARLLNKSKDQTTPKDTF